MATGAAERGELCCLISGRNGGGEAKQMFVLAGEGKQRT